MAHHNIGITFNIDNLTNFLRNSLQRSMNLVGIGLSDINILSDLNGKLPDSNMAFNFSQNEQWDG